MRKAVIVLIAALSLALVSEAVALPTAQSSTPTASAQSSTPTASAATPTASAATHARKCKKIKKKKKRKRCIRRAGPHAPSGTTPPGSGTAPPGTTDQLILATFNAAAGHGDYLYRDHTGYPEGTYWYLVRGNECVRIDSITARCLIYLWKQYYATGYGLGGYDRSVWREYVFGYQYGSSYQFKVNFIDFLDPWYWVCSDTPRYGIPYCNGPVSW